MALRPRTRATRGHGAPLLLLALLGLGPALASGARAAEETPERPTIYKWVDENGIAHYTTDRERIPERLRDRIGRIRREPPPVSAPAAPPTEPAARVRPEVAPARVGSQPAETEPGTEAPAVVAPATLDTPSHWVERDRVVPTREVGAAASDALAKGDRSSEPGGPGALPAVAADARSSGLDRRIASLEAEIAAEEELLKGLLVSPESDVTSALAGDARLRQAAERLPQLLAALRELRDERGDLDDR